VHRTLFPAPASNHHDRAQRAAPETSVLVVPDAFTQVASLVLAWLIHLLSDTWLHSTLSYRARPTMKQLAESRASSTTNPLNLSLKLGNLTSWRPLSASATGGPDQ
jgi:hypothetical protein